MTESPANPTDVLDLQASCLPEGVRALVPNVATSHETCQVNVADLRAWALELGLADVGAATINEATLRGEAQAKESTERWLSAEYHGGLQYMTAPRLTPLQLLPSAKTVLVALAATEHVRPESSVPIETRGTIAAYARGSDYHYVLKDKLWQLTQRLCDALGEPVVARICVDTAPILERYWAACAGVAFIGKSTMAIAPGIGSRVLLGLVLVDRALPSSPPTLDGCGTCTRCLDACPTRAFAAPYVLDARRCISYLTIENSGDIAADLRADVGAHVFGCDVCQTVCPYNASRKLPPPLSELCATRERKSADLTAWVGLTSGEYRRLTQRSALRRTPRAQLQRNAVVALGNTKDPQAIPTLGTALLHNANPLVRKHAAWALGQLAPAASVAVQQLLGQAQMSEADRSVRDAIECVLDELGTGPTDPAR